MSVEKIIKRKQSQKAQLPPPSPEPEEYEPLSDSDSDEKLPVAPPKLVRQTANVKPKPTKKAPIVEPVSDDDSTETDDELEAPVAVKAKKGRPAKKNTAPRAPSLWLTVLKENGFMVKGSFKPTPKKGSDDYIRVRQIFDERKASQ